MKNSSIRDASGYIMRRQYSHRIAIQPETVKKAESAAAPLVVIANVNSAKIKATVTVPKDMAVIPA